MLPHKCFSASGSGLPELTAKSNFPASTLSVKGQTGWSFKFLMHTKLTKKEWEMGKGEHLASLWPRHLSRVERL